MPFFFDSLLRFKPTTRFGRFSLWVMAAYGLLQLVEVIRPLPLSGLWRFLLSLALAVIAIRYAVKAMRWIMRKLLWRLRRRLLITYALIGIVPVFLLFAIMLISGYLIFANLARFFVSDSIDHLSADLDTTARVMLDPVLNALSSGSSPQAVDWNRQLVPLLESLGPRFSKVWINAQNGSRSVALEFHNGRIIPRDNETVPAWLRADTTGIFDDASESFMAAYIVRRGAKTPSWLLVRAPLDSAAFKFISDRALVEIDVNALVPSPRGDVRIGLEGLQDANYEFKSTLARSRADSPHTTRLARYDFPIQFTHLIRSRVWETGSTSGSEPPIYMLHLVSTWLRLARRLFSVGLGVEGVASVSILLMICTVFLIIELVALLTAILMTRTITGAVHSLDTGARHIMSGDLSHRIPVKVEDQLSSLAGTFNSMAVSMQRLLKEEAEKQRLDSELAIAREVQQHLFPREAPYLRRLQISSRCQPARIVSGDYYDYLVITPTALGIALGDVSGKGVSAALLMASLQAALRSHLGILSSHSTVSAMETYGRAEAAGVAVAAQVSNVVSALNQQFYQNTPMEKYATFFYGIYDDSTARLTYTNAGHLPALVFTAAGVDRLETGGTVVGLFPDVEYEQGEVRLTPGDVLVAYTDGITEAESPEGEEFGEQRLIDVVLRSRAKPSDRIIADILRTVSDWIGPAEPQDDMTLIVAKAV